MTENINDRIQRAKNKRHASGFFDSLTLRYYIETNRDGLAEDAKAEWKRRHGVDYPEIRRWENP